MKLRRNMNYEGGNMKYELRNMNYEIWNMKYKIRNMKCEIRYRICTLGNVKREARVIENSTPHSQYPISNIQYWISIF